MNKDALEYILSVVCSKETDLPLCEDLLEPVERDNLSPVFLKVDTQDVVCEISSSKTSHEKGVPR